MGFCYEILVQKFSLIIKDANAKDIFLIAR